VLVLGCLGVTEQVVGVVRVGVADQLVAPVDQLTRVGLWHVEQSGQYLDREVGADVGDEVELGPGQCGVDGGLGQVAQEALVVAHQVAGAELALDQLAERAVPHSVGLQQRAADVHQVVVDLFEVDELGRGERLGVLVDRADVLVLGD
jgi:hypothetical protein